ncbi:MULTISPECIES: hypothetical protein [unclassified Agromyces]|uniref:hypothetical protein n=1 Tax=unclassified Agromyces TaxID=2639701 RepID=UPI00301493FA
MIWSNPGVFASGAWIGGETLREVYVKSGMRAIAAGILNEAGVSPASYELIDVPLSADELETALLDASAALHDTGVVYSSIAPLPETGELSVAAPSGSSLVTATDPTLAKLRVSEPTAILLAKLEDLGVRWVTTQELGSADSAVADDATPNGGSRIAATDGQNTYWCSISYPIQIPALSVNGTLTAGHCLDRSWSNNGYYRGSQFTTTYPSAADLRGDWQILTGGTAASTQRWIWTGGITSSTSSQITAMQFNSYRLAGQQLCASGSVTGSTCRYYVVNPVLQVNQDGVYVWPVTTMNADFNNNGVRGEKPADCGGWTSGDSGGATYFGNASGVTGYGIINGSTKPSTCPIRADNGKHMGSYWWTTPVKAVKDFYPDDTAIGGFSRCSGDPCPPGG